MKRTLVAVFALCALLCLCLVACGPQELEKGVVTDIQDLSKVYDGVAVANPTFLCNNKNPNVVFTYLEKNSQKVISAPTDAGEYVVQIALDEYNGVSAVQAQKDFAISKAQPSYTLPNDISALSGDTLGNIDISSYGLAWENPETVVSVGGNYAAKTTADQTNYEIVSVQVAVRIVANAVVMPTLSASFVYDGSEKSVAASLQNFDANVMTLETTSVLSAINAGVYTVVVTLKNTETHCWEDRTSGSITLSWQIEKATPQQPQLLQLSATYSPTQTLANISLPQGFVWQDGTIVPTCDVSTYKAVYNPDSNNYNNLVCNVALRVEKATPAYTLPTNLTGKTGSALSTVSLPQGFVWCNPSALLVDGTDSYLATFTPQDQVNYNTAQVWLEVLATSNTYTFKITYVSGTENCYDVVENSFGETTVTFTEISAKTVYRLEGTLVGNIVVDVGDSFKFELELYNATVESAHNCPVEAISGDEFTLSAKNGTENFITDKRPAVTSEQRSATIYSAVDLILGGKGKLTVLSQNNNGVHTKDDLEVKNLTLSVTCKDNALKGNDSVTITSGTITLVASQGDGIKTSNSAKKYNADGTLKKVQGTVSVLSGDVTVYAAADGIDAAYNVEISGGKLSVFTDKYSPYSEEISAVADGTYYIRYNSRNYNFSVKYEKDNGDVLWKNATAMSSQGGRPGATSNYYFKVIKPAGYNKLTVYMYSTTQTQGQDQIYTACTERLSVNNERDMLALTKSGSVLNVSWSNYTTSAPGVWPPGGMQDGNPDKADYSSKGIKADNEIIISAGTVEVKSYDDALHTNSDVTLGDPDDTTDDYRGTGNIVIGGGNITLYSNDDGMHADGLLTVNNGTINITNSYEGLEGTNIVINGGNISIVSTDDGVNATATSGQGLVINDGLIYVCAGGDGLDANSKTSYAGIVFAGGKVVVINTSGGNSPLDTEAGYKYTGGLVVAIGPSNSMWNESIKCNSNSGFSSVGCYKSNVASANYIVVSGVAAVKMPKTMTSVVIVLGGGTSNSIISTSSTSTDTFDANGVCWQK